MKTTIKDNVLHIEIPLHTPRPSATSKTLTVANSNGNKETVARIAGAPARVPNRGFVLPTLAVHVLIHPDISTRDAAVQQADMSDDSRIQFRSMRRCSI